MHPAFLENLVADAIADYRQLLDRGYPDRGVLRLVGDRYRLTGEQRTVLYRGVCATDAAGRRRCLLTTLPAVLTEDRTVRVDGYNQIMTIMNYRLGSPVFVSDDGLVRDAGSAHRRTGHSAAFAESIRVFCEFVARKGLRVVVLLDEPMTASKDHARLVRRTAELARASIECVLLQSVDRELQQAHMDVIATSDSAVLDRHGAPALDLAHAVLESQFAAELPDLSVQYPSRTSR